MFVGDNMKVIIYLSRVAGGVCHSDRLGSIQQMQL
jgi:hypothetical protein